MSETNRSCNTCHGKTTPRNEYPEGFGWAGPKVECPECKGVEVYLGAEPTWYAALPHPERDEAERLEQEKIRKRISDPTRLP
jgi:hypothetical protein